MGTRSLIMVVHKSETKVAQYSQFDGYLEGQGMTVLNFCKKVKWPQFIEKLARLRWITDEEIRKVNSTPHWYKEYPYLTREIGANLLDYINNNDALPTGLKNNEAFAGDSLFCEYAYVIDLDKKNLEVYTGFQEKPPPKGERFGNRDDLEKVDGYYPIKLLRKYPLNKLPTKREFLELKKSQE